jgi:hypothetical protein
MATILCKGAFAASKVGKTGLTVTVDLWRIAFADGAATEVVTGGSATEAGDGIYLYRYDAADLALYDYVAVFKTTDTSVNQQHVFGQPVVIPTATQNADALLTRDWTQITGAAARSVLNALRFLRNKWSISGGTLTVTEEDDTATAWTAALTGTSGADPITAVDPS